MPIGPGGWLHGATIDKKTKKVRFLSVSQIETADSCLRKWWYEKVDGRKPPEQEWQTAGTNLHAEIEKYLRTGEKHLSSLAMSGFFAIPEPGPDLLIERDLLVPLKTPDLIPTRENSQALLDGAHLRANDIPVLGQLDLAHDRGVNKGGSDIEATIDPPGTVEVIDWKSTSDFKWAKTGPELLRSAQMSGYGVWIANQIPEVQRIRLSHIYFRTKGTPAARKSTILTTPEQVRESWEHSEGVAALVANAAKATKADDVQFNLDACDKYRGCPHRGYCTAGMDVGVSVILGLTQSDALKPSSQGLVPMASLLSRVNQKASPVPPSAPDPAAIAAERNRLEMEEKTAKLKALIPPGFEKACADIRALGVGFPTLLGKAAVANAAVGGQAIAEEGAKLSGFGEYGYVEIDDPTLMGELLSQLVEATAKNSPMMEVSPLPPDAPESDPALAYKDISSQNATPAPQEQLPLPAVSGVVEAVKEKTEKTGAKRGPKPKEKTVEKPEEPASFPIHGVDARTSLALPGAITLFIDCRPSVPHTDLYAWVNEIADRISAQYQGVDKDGKIVKTLDLRSAPANSGAGFDNWKGILFAMCRSDEHTPLTPGAYYIDTRGSQVREIAADALKERAERSGGYYVRSAR